MDCCCLFFFPTSLNAISFQTTYEATILKASLFQYFEILTVWTSIGEPCKWAKPQPHGNDIYKFMN